MQEFLKTFQKQQVDTAERYAQMAPEVRAELENQKQAAKDIYNENEMRKSFANMNMRMPASIDAMTSEDTHKVNAAAMIKANDD